MAKGMKTNQAIGLVLVVGVLILAGVYVGSGKTLSVSQSTGQIASSSGTCPTTGFTTVSLLGSYVASNGVVITPAVSSSIYVQGASSPSNTVTTGSSATLVGSTISCSPSQTVYATYGDASSSSYYLQATPAVSATGAITQLFDSNLLPVVAPSSPVFVNSQNGTYASSAIYKSAGNSQVYTTTMNLQAGNGVYGNNKIELLVAYNSTEISSVSITGSGAVSQSAVIPASTTYQSGYTTVAYSIPAIEFYNSTSMQVVVKTNALNSNTAVDNPIQIFLKDSASYLNNGQLFSNQYIDSVTNSNIGHASIAVNPASEVINSGGSAVALSSSAINIYS